MGKGDADLTDLLLDTEERLDVPVENGSEEFREFEPVTLLLGTAPIRHPLLLKSGALKLAMARKQCPKSRSSKTIDRLSFIPVIRR